MASVLFRIALPTKFARTPLFSIQPCRFLNLHEYQSKKLLADGGINVQRFRVVQTADEASKAGIELMNTIAKELVIKAQVLAGGRGKGTFDSGLKGGVQLTKDTSLVKDLTSEMLGHRIFTKQTGPDGVEVKRLMIAEALDIARETYLAILLDRATGGPVVVGSPCGGVDIEEVAENTPDKIIKVPVDPATGLTKNQANKVVEKLEFKGKQHEIAVEQLLRLYELFIRNDCTMLEINPFGETPDGRVVCFDAKLVFDDSAAFRHKEITTESDPREVLATKLGLNFVSLPGGNIGCMVNGAGLAMATMDMIKMCGGEPSNFLDLGGSVQQSQVRDAFDVLRMDPNVKVILINIFGGIVNCETVARGIIDAFKIAKLECPLVVRLEGTNVEAGKKLIADSNLPIIPANDLADAASKAVDALKKL
ncbi:hypothetical protein ACOME3_001796 [Neoechinorhynchus agilis]